MSLLCLEDLIKRLPSRRSVKNSPIRVMSYNIRWKRDEISVSSCWEFRKNHVASMLRFHKTDLIGLQEPLEEQIADLAKELPEYSFYGVGRDDGKREGAIDAIVFRKDRFKPRNSGSFFLSSTPETPGKGWDATLPRGVTWMELEDLKTKELFFFFNTHFDYHGKEARDKSALLLREKIASITQGKPFIVTGDFNLFPTLGGEKTYALLTEKEGEIPGKALIDAKEKTQFPHHGPTGTWTGFKEAGQPGIKPDYIFIDESIEVIMHGILSDSFDGHFPSDHLPVVADLII